MLDKTQKYSSVSGDSKAKFYQDGKYYDGRGEEIDAETAGKPSSGGNFEARVKARVAQELRDADTKGKRLEVIDNTNAKTNSPKNVEAARKRAAARAQPKQSTRELSPTEVKDLRDRDSARRAARLANLEREESDVERPDNELPGEQPVLPGDQPEPNQDLPGDQPEPNQDLPEPEAPPVPDQELPEDKERKARRKKLKKLHTNTIKKMVDELGLEVPVGPGSKKAGIDLILDNTE